jgi:ATP-dependent helicase/nuclease subunit B
VQVRLLLGPAGSGKTFQCLDEAREALSSSPEGLPLLLIAPKQGTYQLEQQLLSMPSLAGYTRLSILSFESLARFIFDRFGKPVPQVLTEEGRLMVLRSLLTTTRRRLKLFRASARLTGFARQLSQVLSELQRARVSPATLSELAAQIPDEGLSYKLQDLAMLLQSHLEWLEAHHLQDEEALLRSAAALLKANPAPALGLANLWVDGFAEFSELELELLSGLLSRTARSTVTFCLDPESSRNASWLSHWSVVRKTLENCQKRFGELPNVELVTQSARRQGSEGRFSHNTVLRHLEQRWVEPQPYPAEPATGGGGVHESVRLVSCSDRDQEAVVAAREILRFVRAGARYRDVSVLVRNLDLYYQVLQRVFARYQIPFFLDRRESVSHHPLAELTRGAVRVAALGWQHADWFAVLKSGLVPSSDEDVDLLENEALARGWKGRVWHQPIRLTEVPKTEQDRQRIDRFESRLESIRGLVVPPFEKFARSLSATENRPTGLQLASAIRELWNELEVQRRLESWAAAERSPPESPAGLSVHETVWKQVQAWLDNAQLAFPNEALPLRDWLPILETSLANLSVGIIPPALDQVLVGAVDRSRTPAVKLALVLGLNESVFPSVTEPAGLLTERDRVELEKRDVALWSSTRYRLGRENYLGYIACTRASQKLVLTWALRDPTGTPLNPSSLLWRLRRLFPQVEPELAAGTPDWRESEHPTELVEPLLRMRSEECNARSERGESRNTDPSTEPETPSGPQVVPGTDGGRIFSHPTISGVPSTFARFPGLASLFDNLQQFGRTDHGDALSPDLAARLYSPVLRTSVSRMEQFAACPFRFFVHSGLRAEERKRFELDVREQGTFQHDALALFHQQLREEQKRWRDITPAEARQRIERIAGAMSRSFRDGLLATNDENQFTAGVLSESLQDFVETLVDWMHSQYEFDPVEVEFAFGEDGTPAWRLDLGQGHGLELKGRIDRIDLFRQPGSDSALCVVLDYKSSQKQLEPVLVQHGLQLQLLMYLNVLRQWLDPKAIFGVARLEPAGVFYVSLRGFYSREPNRREALANPGLARKLAYRHTGRFDVRVLPQLDSRSGALEGDQFNYRRTRQGQVSKVCKEAVASPDFEALLTGVQRKLLLMGQQVFSGCVEVSPYRKGATTACDQCSYHSICRVDPWIQRYRLLRKTDEAAE